MDLYEYRVRRSVLRKKCEDCERYQVMRMNLYDDRCAIFGITEKVRGLQAILTKFACGDSDEGRGGARRQALLPDHMSGEEVPSARQQFEGGDRADAFQGARIPDGRARPARHVLRSDRLVDYVYYPLEPAEYWWQLEEQLSQELDGIDVIFGNLLAVVILVEQVEDQPGVHRQHDKIKR
ncbi:unnamed protein product [Trichogramma brassicae]|uniref:Uncharacterized protein n=1 Tax=Trichogramma brassicae TaxID=86971 RepID=A0A6H5J6C0_9HYME|nr:unnamed protein product [Trichogramma brassicae]